MKPIYAACFMLLISHSTFADVVSKSYWGDKAIGSHDTVSYHTPNAREHHLAVKGVKKHSVSYQGANWYFASQTSADKFAADPAKYKPRYNGFCANALSLGEGLITTDGQVWEFFGEQLHLFYAERGRQRWINGDWKSYQDDANAAWQNLKNG
jgi:YHS domain-containing protein